MSFRRPSEWGEAVGWSFRRRKEMTDTQLQKKSGAALCLLPFSAAVIKWELSMLLVDVGSLF